MDFDKGLYRFASTRGAEVLPGFEPLAGLPDLHQIDESPTLFPLFKNRLLPPARSEYQDYLKWGGFNPSEPPEPLVILGRTEGIEQTDAVEAFPCPVPDAQGSLITSFFAHGARDHLPNAK